MQTIRHLALGACILCDGAGMIRLFWPENSFKPVINTILLLYIITAVFRVGTQSDWKELAAALRSAALPETAGTQAPAYGEYSREVALQASVQALGSILEQNGIACTARLCGGVCLITLQEPQQKEAASALLARYAGTLPWQIAAEGGGAQ